MFVWVAACGGGSPNLEEEILESPAPPFSDPSALQNDVEEILEEVDQAMNNVLSGLEEEGSTSKVAKGTSISKAAEFLVDLSTYPSVSGRSSGTATPSGTIYYDDFSENEDPSENEWEFEYSNVGAQLRDFSQNGIYILDGRVSLSGVTRGTSNENSLLTEVEMTQSAQLTVRGKIGATVIMTTTVNGSFETAINSEDHFVTTARGTVNGDVIVFANGQRARCVLSGDFSSSEAPTITCQSTTL